MKIRPRFRLRTLFVAVALAAVASWAYWVAWPWWVLHQEQVEFVDSARQLRKDSSPFKDSRVIRSGAHCGRLLITTAIRPRKRPEDLFDFYVWSNAVYCIHYTTTRRIDRDDPGYDTLAPSDSVELLRLTSISTDRARPRLVDNAIVPYFQKYAAYISGERTAEPGFEYQVIYADPPK